MLSTYQNAELSMRTLRVMVRSMSEAFLIPLQDLPRVLFHGGLLACIISGFWLLDSLKDPILANTVGIEWQPFAKLFSVITTMLVVCLYDFATTLVRKPQLFHIVAGGFGLLMMIMGAELNDPDHGLPNRVKGTHRWVGWVCYFTIEAYGSLMVALFWSFTNSIMDLEQAKGAYGLIISIAQVGAIIGSTLATSSKKVGIPQLCLVGSMSIFSVSLLVKIYMITFKDPHTEAIRIERVRSLIEEEVAYDDDDDDVGVNSVFVNSAAVGSSSSDDAFDQQSPLSTTLPPSSKHPPQTRNFHNNNNNNNNNHNNNNNNNNISNNNISNNNISNNNFMTSQFIRVDDVGVGAGTGSGSSSGSGNTDIHKVDSSSSSHSGSSIRSRRPKTLMRAFRKVFGGFYEGLVLILSYRYTIYLAGISCLFEVVMTVLDYEFKLMGADSIAMHPTSLAEGGINDGNEFALLLGRFGQVTNLLSFIVSFFGFSFLVHRIGVKHSLLVFPGFLFVAVVITNLVPSLWVLFVLVSILKALIFSLNEPVKELLYIPTSDPIKFKAKAWIDAFGCRLAKAMGSIITSFAHGRVDRLRNYSEIPCIVITLLILILSWVIGSEFQRMIEKGVVVGDDRLTRLGRHKYDLTHLEGRIRSTSKGGGGGGGEGDAEDAGGNGSLVGRGGAVFDIQAGVWEENK